MWDIGIFEALNYDGGAFWDEFWWIVTGKLTWAPLYVAILVLLWRKFGWRGMLLAAGIIVAAVGAVDQIAGFFKSSDFAWARLRPTHTPGLDRHLVHNYHGGLYGTVSAHAATTTAVAVISCAPGASSDEVQDQVPSPCTVKEKSGSSGESLGMVIVAVFTPREFGLNTIIASTIYVTVVAVVADGWITEKQSMSSPLT